MKEPFAWRLRRGLPACLLVAIAWIDPPSAAADASAGQGAAANTCPVPEVESARVVDGAPSIVRPGRTLEVRLKGFDAWLECQRQSTTPLPTLYLDHSARPEFRAGVDALAKALRYELTLSESNRGWWVAFVTAAEREQGAAVGIGTSAVEQFAVSDTEVRDPAGSARREAFKGLLVDGRTHIIGWSFVGVLVLGSLFVAWLTPLIRDGGPLAPNVNDWQRSFSLARTQLFLWTLVVVGVAGVVWIWTGVLPALGVETLSLLGISAGTSGISRVIDGKQQAPVQAASKFFVSDLINDGNGASIHRFQAVLVNVGLATIFVIQSLHELDFYAIPPSWSALLALSSGLYLGLKTGEP
jgi:hypothetical protein